MSALGDAISRASEAANAEHDAISRVPAPMAEQLAQYTPDTAVLRQDWPPRDTLLATADQQERIRQSFGGPDDSFDVLLVRAALYGCLAKEERAKRQGDDD